MSVPAAIAGDPLSRTYHELMSRAVGEGNDHVFASMIASWQSGESAMPDWLGLSPAAFRCVMEHHFPGADLALFTVRGTEVARERSDDLVLRRQPGEVPKSMLEDLAIADRRRRLRGCARPIVVRGRRRTGAARRRIAPQRGRVHRVLLRGDSRRLSSRYG